MLIVPSISPRIIPSIASIYTDVNRIIMEYVDNSFDSAENLPTIQGEVDFSDYLQQVEIKIKIEGDNYKNGKISILDNCGGIPDLTQVLQNIGNSSKKAQIWTNGEFGYGIFSFMAACENLEVKTKSKSGNFQYSVIKKDDFNKDKIEDVAFIIDNSEFDFPYESGTQITLSQFRYDKWNQFNVVKLKEEIQNHFELLLRRKNLIVTIEYAGNEMKCEPFNYDQYEGEIIDINFKLSSNKKGYEFIDSDNIRIFLKYTKGVSLERPPVFISRRRRIAEVCNVQKFRTYNKSGIWGHPNITGFIDVGVTLNPTIARNDYRNDERSRKLFREIKRHEEEIEKRIRELTKANQITDFSKIENEFNSVLNILDSGKLSDTNTPRIGDIVTLNSLGNEHFPVLVEVNRKKNKNAETDENSLLEGKNVNASSENSFNRELKLVESSIDNSAKTSRTIRLRIDGDSIPPIDKNQIQKRSEYFMNEVVLFRKHPDFEDRVGKKMTGEEFITQSLITYLIGEVLIYYMEKENREENSVEKYSGKELLVRYSSNLYLLEQKLQKLDGEPISKLS